MVGGGEPDKFLIWVAAVSPSIIRLSNPYRGITLKILVSILPLEKEEGGSPFFAILFLIHLMN